MTYASGFLHRLRQSPHRAISLACVSRLSVLTVGSAVPLAIEAAMASVSASKTVCVALMHSFGVSPLIASIVSHRTKNRALNADALTLVLMPSSHLRCDTGRAVNGIVENTHNGFYSLVSKIRLDAKTGFSGCALL